MTTKSTAISPASIDELVQFISEKVRELHEKCGQRMDGSLLAYTIRSEYPEMDYTHAENMKHAFQTGLVNNTGENNGQAKLQEPQVKEIKTLLRNGGISQERIAERYNVSRSCVLGINVGRLWAHVPAQ